MSYLAEALRTLNEEEFDISTAGLEDLTDFVDNTDAINKLNAIDTEAKEQSELADSYVGKVILQCNVCHELIYKDPEDVVVGEDGDLVNIGEECPICLSTDGYKIIGQVGEYGDPENSTTVTVDPDGNSFDESLITKYTSKSLTEGNKYIPSIAAGTIDINVNDKLNTEFGKWEVVDIDGQDLKLKPLNKKARSEMAETPDDCEDGCLWMMYDGLLDSEFDVIRPDGSVEHSDEEGNVSTVDKKNKKRPKKSKVVSLYEKAKSSIKLSLPYQFKLDFEPYDLEEAGISGFYIWVGYDYLLNRNGIINYWDELLNEIIPNEVIPLFADLISSLLHKPVSKNQIHVDKAFKAAAICRVWYGSAEDDLGETLGENLEFEDTDNLTHSLYQRILPLIKQYTRKGLTLDELDSILEEVSYRLETDDEISFAEDDNYDYDASGRLRKKYDADAAMKKFNSLKSEALHEEFNDRHVRHYKSIVDDYLDSHPYDYSKLDVAEDIAEEVCLAVFSCDYNNCNNEMAYAVFSAIDDRMDDYDEDEDDEYVESLHSMKKFNSLKENIEHVNIETDTQVLDMGEDEDGKVQVTTEPKADTLEPVDAGTEDQFQYNTEEEGEPSEEEVEEGDYEDVEPEEFDEESFDELGESYLKEAYDNVKSYKTTSVSMNDNNLVVEGLITFNTGSKKKTSFVFESYQKVNGKFKFLGENIQITPNKKSAFSLRTRLDNGKLVCEALRYNYKGCSGIVVNEGEDLSKRTNSLTHAIEPIISKLQGLNKSEVYDLVNKTIKDARMEKVPGAQRLLDRVQKARSDYEAISTVTNSYLAGGNDAVINLKKKYH